MASPNLTLLSLSPEIEWVGRGSQVALIQVAHESGLPPARFRNRRPGQFLIVSRQKTNVCGIRYWSEPHPFTISNEPENPNLEMLIRQTRGWFTQGLVTVKPGDRLLLQGPFGILCPDLMHETETVLIGGGLWGRLK